MPTVVSVSFVSASQLNVTIDAPKGGKGDKTWDVRVGNPGGATGALSSGLTIH
jgi:hypothetical protein